MRKYATVIEHGENDLSAYVPDLAGCISTGRTVEEIERHICEAIELHLERDCEKTASRFLNRTLLSRTLNYKLRESN